MYNFYVIQIQISQFAVRIRIYEYVCSCVPLRFSFNFWMSEEKVSTKNGDKIDLNVLRNRNT